MNTERVKEIYSDFLKALERLKEALSEDLSKGDIVIDGTIQRFEFTFELGWKLIKRILSDNGIEVGTPRLVIKEAFKEHILDDGEDWIWMLEDRNKTAHIYDKAQAMEIYEKIKKNHCRTLENFKKDILKFVKE